MSVFWHPNLILYPPRRKQMYSFDKIRAIISEADLDDKFEEAASKTPNINKHILKIAEDYDGKDMCYRNKCESTAQQLLMAILRAEKLRDIHSARYRVKTADSLIAKYVKKRAMLPKDPGNNYNIEKYRPMDSSNYHKIITDLIGIRILIRYQQQWALVHDWIWDTFFKPEKEYIKNWIDDYPSGERVDFIVEKPRIYLRDNKERPLYETRGKNTFEIHDSNEGYNSLHYLIWYDGKYVEIQVRTIYDEAWSECTHDLVYKCKNKKHKAELEDMSVCLATQTQAAGMLASMMYEKSDLNKEKKKPEKEELPQNSSQSEKLNKRFTQIEKRIHKMDQSKKEKVIFDGRLDELIDEKGENKENE